MIARRREGVLIRAGYCALIQRALLLALILTLVFTQAFLITQNSGQGMFPSLKDGDLCIVYRTGLRKLLGEKYARDHIIVYQAGGARRFGRVVAVGGEIVMLDDSGSLTVNAVSESGGIMFPTYAQGDQEYPLKVPENCLFVLGDHRTDAVDSRTLGPIPLESVEGKVITILRRRGL